jgi:hypothetical protein
MFYTGISTYPALPTKKQVQELKEKGYKIYILNEKPIADWIKKDKSIEILDDK